MPRKGKKSNNSSSKSGLGISSAGAIRLAHAQKRAGVPPFTYANLVYPFAFSSSSTTGSVWYWQWRLNSLFDPDFTGSGSQPTTFDQWMALYDRYRVIATEVEISVQDFSAPNAMTSCAFAPSVDAVPTLTFTGIAGMRDAVISLPKNGQVNRFKRTYLMKDVFGVDEEAMMSELNFSGTSGTSAPSVAYGSLGVTVFGGTTDPVCIAGCLRFAVRFEAPHANNVSLTRDSPMGAVPFAPSPAPALGGASIAESSLLSEVRAYLESRAATARSASSPAGLLPAAVAQPGGSRY